MSEEPQKKLWAVDIEGTMLVLAESAERASDVAHFFLDEASEEEVRARPHLPTTADLDQDALESYPHGGDGLLTVAEWIEKEASAAGGAA